jgi:hypothetical protein
MVGVILGRGECPKGREFITLLWLLVVDEGAPIPLPTKLPLGQLELDAAVAGVGVLSGGGIDRLEFAKTGRN